jgi:nucleotide-binding universal stress UspA family protein
MKKIIVPCDFSEQAVNAFRVALDIALESKGEIHLVHVVELPVMHDTVLMPVLSFEETLLKELKDKADTNFNKLINKHVKDDQKVIGKVLFGPTSRMLTDYAESQKADVIVMGTHGASGVREFVIGSNAEKIVRSSSIPVLTIKKFVKISSFKNIVFPNTLDTENQEELVSQIKSLQNFFKAKLHILWINTPTNFTSDKITRKRLDAFVKRYMLKDCVISVYNDPYEESGIINYAMDTKADMIAMGTNGRKGLAHILSGSVAEDVVNHVQQPVWTYTLKRK